MKSWKIPRKFWKILSWSLSGLLLFSSIAFVNRKQDDTVCAKVQINIREQGANYFLVEKDIVLLMTQNGEEVVAGAQYQDLNLREIERRIETHKYVRKAEVSRDLRGNLVIDAWQNQPIARLVRADGPDAYISTEGEILPLLDRFTARTLLVSGAQVGELMKHDFGPDHHPELLALIQRLVNDEFWQAQIAQLDLQPNGDIVMLPQVTKQRVEFGQPTEVEAKLRKLRIFYEKILPVKGWNTYDRVNLKYKDQIVCE